jgi:hypothetical protein
MLETFDGFLYDKTRKSRLEFICEKIFKDLTAGASQCYLIFDELNVLTLDYEKKDFLLPPRIHDHTVPVPLANLEIFRHITHDFTIQSVISAIDGKKCVKHIRNSVQLSESQIILCLQHLYYQGIVDFIDLFQVTNIYRVTKKVGKLLSDQKIREEALKHLAKSQDVTCEEIFESYTEMSYKVVSDFLEENPKFVFKFDIELFIAYGVLRGIIKRVHRYFVRIPGPREDKNKGFYINNIENDISPLLNGNVPIDKICTLLMLEQRTIE